MIFKISSVNRPPLSMKIMHPRTVWSAESPFHWYLLNIQHTDHILAYSQNSFPSSVMIILYAGDVSLAPKQYLAFVVFNYSLRLKFNLDQ